MSAEDVVRDLVRNDNLIRECNVRFDALLVLLTVARCFRRVWHDGDVSLEGILAHYETASSIIDDIDNVVLSLAIDIRELGDDTLRMYHGNQIVELRRLMKRRSRANDHIEFVKKLTKEGVTRVMQRAIHRSDARH